MLLILAIILGVIGVLSDNISATIFSIAMLYFIWRK